VKTIDVARELDASIILKADIGRQPLIGIGPKRWIDGASSDTGTICVCSPFSRGLGLGYDLSLATPSIDSIVYADYFVAKHSSLAVDEWIEGRMDEVLNHIVRTGVPVWIILLLELELGERSLEVFMKGLVDQVV
jgi:hypothetical protein